MNRQLRHLLNICERPNIKLMVVPTRKGANVGLRGAFQILEFADEPALVHIENQITGMFLEEQADLAGYRLALRNILSVAFAPNATADMIHAITTEFS